MAPRCSSHRANRQHLSDQSCPYVSIKQKFILTSEASRLCICGRVVETKVYNEFPIRYIPRLAATSLKHFRLL